MEPTPVGVEHDRVVLCRAAVGARTLLDRHLGMRLGGERAGLLAVHDGRVREREEGEGGEHCGEEGVCSVEVVLLSKTRPWGSMLELQSTT